MLANHMKLLPKFAAVGVNSSCSCSKCDINCSSKGGHIYYCSRLETLTVTQGIRQDQSTFSICVINLYLADVY